VIIATFSRNAKIDEALMSRHIMISPIFEKNRASETSQANEWQVGAKFYD
jgi:hypothetical protein